MYALQFPAVNPPPEISVVAALIGRTKRPHRLGASFLAPMFFWFIRNTAGADRFSQPRYVGPGTSSRISDDMCGDNLQRRNHDVRKDSKAVC